MTKLNAVSQEWENETTPQIGSKNHEQKTHNGIFILTLFSISCNDRYKFYERRTIYD